MPTSFVYSPDQHLIYKGLKVRKADWVSFIQNIGFREYAKRCMTEDNIKGAALEARYLQKLT